MRINFHLLALATIIVFIGLSTKNLPAQDICGDANNDASVNVSDAVWIVNYVFIGGPEPDPFLSGEVNCDGSVNISDAVWIINYVFIEGNDPCDVNGDGFPDCDPNCPSTITDYDGNVYQTVLIGDQCWMMENLKVTHYRNGDPVSHAPDSATWQDLTSGAYCNFDNNEDHVETYGRLYNWYAVDDSRKLAPEGWHVPTDGEWKQLEMYLGMDQAQADSWDWRGTDEGGKLKEAGTDHWASPNEGATNSSGFTALPAGYRGEFSQFHDIYNVIAFWCSTVDFSGEIIIRALAYSYSQIQREDVFEIFGLSVRCVKDSPGRIAVNPSPDFINAPWSLSGPNGYTASGNGDDTLSNLEAGEYILTWEPVFGWLRPCGSTRNFVPNHTMIFAGTYSEAPDSTGTVSDFDGNVYQTIKIGDQWWMAENLKATHYRNGDPISHIPDSATWVNLSTGAYCNYDNNEENVPVFGRLYNWFAVDDSRSIAPEGWHVPTDAEWKQLEMFLGMPQAEADGLDWRGTNEGGKLKDTGTVYWDNPNSGATNESGFTALPGVYRHDNGSFLHAWGWYAAFWSSTIAGDYSAWYRQLYYQYAQVRRNSIHCRYGYSIRCIQNTPGTIFINSIPDSINAPWSITGPDGYTSSGNGDDTLTNLEIGDYTISWGIVPDWIRPANLRYTITWGETINIDGNYMEAPDSTGTVSDYDGNVYQTIKIGDQWWMCENLKVTHYHNGDSIPNVTDDIDWENLTTGAYCSYNNDTDHVPVYGRLYNWHAVNDGRNVAPDGWHVPTDAEWKQLEMFLGMSQESTDSSGWRGTDEGGKLKQIGTTHWLDPNTGATNEFAFTALPGGYRLDTGEYTFLHEMARFWSFSECDIDHGLFRFLHCGMSQIGRGCALMYTKEAGLSIRCIKDTPGTIFINSIPDSINAPWSISGPDGYTSSGNGDDTLTNLEIGDYTITWGIVPDWIKPANLRYTISWGDTANFDGNYMEAPDSTGTVTDYDGNVYQTIKIGDQWWMCENLKVTHYRNGDSIPNVTDGGTWSGLSTGAYCDYNNDPANVAIYGRLYNWYAVNDSRNISPEGWHVPSDAELKQLEMYLGMSQAEADAIGWRGTDEGGKLKQTGTTHWQSPNTGATNESGFTALPGGYSSIDGAFNGLGIYAHYWSSTEGGSDYAWYRGLDYDYSQTHRYGNYKRNGFSVRCVKD